VATQVALSLVLLFGALLFVRSLHNLLSADPGFQSQGVLSITLHFPRNSYSAEQVGVIRRELVQRFSSQPGVMSAAQVYLVPFAGNASNGHVAVDGEAITAAADTISYFNSVGPGYFRTMGTTLVAGRDFDDRDTASSLKIAVVNEAFARRFFRGANPIGHTFRHGTSTGEGGTLYEIIGVVEDTKYRSVREQFAPIAFFPISQSGLSGLGGLGTSFVLRVAGPIADTKRNVASLVSELNPGINLEFEVLSEQIDDSLLRERLMATLSAAFGILAALLAALGLYGVISYMVAQRRNEIGIRMALGARRGHVVLLVLREAALLLGAGLVIGAILALWAGRAAGTLLFGIAPYDAVTMVGAALLLAIVALLSSYIPARRAAALDPMVALRNE
jgi:predicted permease